MYTIFESQAWTTEQDEEELGELALDVSVDVGVVKSEVIEDSEPAADEVLDDAIGVDELANDGVLEETAAGLVLALVVLPAMLFLMLSHLESG